MTWAQVLFIVKKTNGATRKARTHFEQVPIDVVKRVAEADVSREENAAPDRVSDPAAGKSRPRGVPSGSRRPKRR